MTREGADDSGSQDLPDLEGLVIPDDLSSLFGDASATGQEVAGHSPDGETAIEEEALPRYINTTAVVLTAVKQAKVLASLLALAGIEAAVVPSAKGAIAVRYVEQLESEADPAEFLSGFPREAEALGAALSVAARSETVLLAARVSSIDGEVTGANVGTEALAALSSWWFWVPVVVFYLAFWLLGAIINRGSWAHWVIFGLLVGVASYGGHLLGQLFQAPFWQLTASQGQEVVRGQLLAPLAIVAFVLGRELTIWFGGWVAARGKRVSDLNREAQRDYERTLEAGPRLHQS